MATLGLSKSHVYDAREAQARQSKAGQGKGQMHDNKKAQSM